MYKAFKLSPFAHSKILNQVCVRAYKYTMLMITNTVILEALYFKFGAQKSILRRHYFYWSVHKYKWR